MKFLYAVKYIFPPVSEKVLFFQKRLRIFFLHVTNILIFNLNSEDKVVYWRNKAYSDLLTLYSGSDEKRPESKNN